MLFKKLTIGKIIEYLKNKYKYIQKIIFIVIICIELILWINDNINIFKKLKKYKINFSYNYIGGDFFESLTYNNRIYYSETHSVENAFQTSNYYDILLTHNSDHGVTEELFQKFLKSGKFKYWFAQNIKVIHKKLFALPIGLENAHWRNFSKYKIIMEELKKNIKPTKLLFASFSIRTNRKKRIDCINSFKNKTYLTNNVNLSDNIKRIKPPIEEYKEFVDEILNHYFTLCPEGNGIDTHRFWEVLYLKRFPVVLHNPVTDSFSDLPILILNKWSDFENEYKKFLKKVKNNAFSYEKLKPSYWRNLLMRIN